MSCKHEEVECASCLWCGESATTIIAALREENAKLKAQAERAEHGWSGCDILRTEAYAKIRRLRDVLESAPEPKVLSLMGGESYTVENYPQWFHGPRSEALGK